MAGVKRRRDGTVPEMTPPSTEDEANDAFPPNYTAEVPFTIEILKSVDTRPKKAKKTKTAADDHSDTRVQQSEGVQPIPYVVRPGTLWDSQKKYKNFVVSDNTFGINDYIYVNHNVAANIAAAEAGQEPSIKDDDVQDFWIAKVLEIRASGSANVYIRVYWMYWPQDIPGGRKSYHGKSELIASNHMDIIDAMTVAGKAEVTRFEEKDDEPTVPDLYWRQTYDTVTNKVSQNLRRGCVCSGFHNPDKLLIHCEEKECDKWLHEDCIVEYALDQEWERLAGGDQVASGDRKESKLGKKAGKEGFKPWKGKLTGKLEAEEVEGGETKTISGKITITDIRNKKKHQMSTVDAVCPNCHVALSPA